MRKVFSNKIIFFAAVILMLLFPASVFSNEISENFIDAVKKDDALAVSKFIDEGLAVNETLPGYSETPLIIAVQNNALKSVNLLLLKGADVNMRINSYSDTALIIAAQKDFTAIADLLIENKADADLTGEYNYSALYHAVHNKNYRLIGNLLKITGNRDNIDWVGLTSFYHAVNTNDIKIAEMFINDGYDVNAEFEWRDFSPENALQLAAENGSLEMVKFLVERGADVNGGNDVSIYGQKSVSYHRNAMYFAVNSDKKLPIVKYLISKGSLMDYEYIRNESPLLLSAYYGSSEICRYLYSLGLRQKQISHDYGSLFEAACHGGILWLMTLMVERGENVNSMKNGKVPLIEACSSANPDAVSYLLASGADPAAAVEYWTPLKAAVDAGAYECVRILFQAGIKPDTVDSYGNNALHYCFRDIYDYKNRTRDEILSGRKKIIKFLLENDINYMQVNTENHLAGQESCPPGLEKERNYVKNLIQSKKGGPDGIISY